MFSALEDLLFEFFNMYLRNGVLDIILPFFEGSVPVFLVTIISLVLYAIYSKKTHGELLCRFILFFGMIALSIYFADKGSKAFSFERPRPYQEIAGTMYYNDRLGVWSQSEIEKPQNTSEVIEQATNQTDVNVDDILNATSEKSTEENVKTISNSSDELNSINKYVINGQAKLYPSSVISISMAVAFVIALLVTKAMPYIYLFPLIIGWAQVYTGHAYLSDIIMGWFIGIISVVVAWICFALFFRYTVRN